MAAIGFAFHGVRVESLEFFDGEFYLFTSPFSMNTFKPAAPFDLGNFLDRKLAEFGYLMHTFHSFYNEQQTNNKKNYKHGVYAILSELSEGFFVSFYLDDTKFFEHFVDDGEEGGFGHGAALDAFVDGDDFVEVSSLFRLGLRRSRRN